MINTQDSLQTGSENVASPSWLRSLGAAFKDQFQLYFVTYFIVGATFLLAFFVGMKVGLAIDLSGIIGVMKTMFQVMIVLGGGFMLVMLFSLARQKSENPTSDLLGIIKARFRDTAKFSQILHILILFSLASVAFAVLKSSIALLNPFSWDLAFRDLDKTLHFGRYPHEWFGWVMNSPIALFVLNFFYNLWFFIIFVYLYVFASRYGSTKEGLQFYHAFFMSWILIGFFAATYFSSGGPCYFERLGLGDDYVPLMDKLHAANESVQIWALGTQDMLWDGQEGARQGRLGISAFPSMHVAIATIMALASSSVSRIWGIIVWIFAAMIMMSSVLLGWHYAVDGYASIIMVIILWWVSGKMADWILKRKAQRA